MGSVRVNKSGYLYLDFYYMGVRCREGTHLNDTPKNRKWLENKFKAIEEEILRGEFDYEAHFPEGNKLSLFGRKRIEGRVLMKDFVELWFKEKIPALKPSTILTHRSSLRHIVSCFGNHYLDQITEADINLFRSELAKTKTNRGRMLSNKRINNILVPLREMLSVAKRRRLIYEHPMEWIKPLKARRGEIDPLSFQEMGIFLEHVPKDYYNYFVVAFMTGMRPNEQMALKWRNVDFVNKKISVREGRVLNIDGLPKTESAIRDIDMLPMVERAFINQKTQTFLHSKYVFLNRKGRPIRVDTLRRRIWEPTLKRAGLRHRTLYQTRHTFASLALASGENINWIASMMGHSTLEMIRNYNKFIPNLTRQDGILFEGYLEKVREKSYGQYLGNVLVN